MWNVLEAPLTPQQCKVIAAYSTLNHRLAIESEQRTIILTSTVTKLSQFLSCHAIVNEAHFMLEWPQYNPIKDKLRTSLFENIVLGSLKSFFQLDHQVDISLHLT